MAEFAYKVGDRVKVDREVLEDYGQAVTGWTNNFKDLDNAIATVNYIREPWVFRGVARKEPTIGVEFDEIEAPRVYSQFYYYPNELDLVERGVNSSELTKLTQVLHRVAAKFDGLTS